MSDADRAQSARNDDDGEAGRTRADVARDAMVQSLVSNVVYLAVMVGFTVALANRDRIGRLVLAVGRRWSAARAAEERAVAEFRAEISGLEHGHGWQE